MSILTLVGVAFAQTISRPSVPEFTVEAFSSQLSQTVQISIKNQPFTPYQITENGSPQEINLYYNIRYRTNPSSEWSYYHLYNGSSDGNLKADYGSQYTIRSIDLTHVPSGSQVDFQVEALVGYQQGVIQPFSTPRIIVGQSSGWSNTQTATIPETSTSPTPTSPTTSTPTSTPISPDTNSDSITLPLSTFTAIIVIVVVIAFLALALSILALRKQRKTC
jgi:hypothetical protein